MYSEMLILETNRLTLHEFKKSDAVFLLNIMNQPDYHRYIGDRGIRTIENAETYIAEKFEASYRHLGFGFWLIREKESRTPVGFAGLIKREELSEPDVGYAIDEKMSGNGFAEEATRGILTYVRDVLSFPVVSAITDPENHASINVLTKCGFHFDECVPVFDDGEALNVYRLKMDNNDVY